MESGPAEVADGIWELRQSIPGGTMPYTLSYLLRDGGGAVHVIDPGWDSDENWTTLVHALIAVGRRATDIASVTATHLHSDHLGLAPRIRAATGARVGLGRREKRAMDALASGEQAAEWARLIGSWGVPRGRRDELKAVGDASIRPAMRIDVLLDDGDRLDIAGRDVRAITTPGHTAGHLAFEVADERLVLTGDHVLPITHSGIGLGGPSNTNPVVDYLESLRRIARYDDHEVLPGHEHRFAGLAERCRVLAERQEQRSDEVRRAIEADADATVWQIASTLTWSAGWENLFGTHLRSALAQTAMHLEVVRTD